MARKPRIEFEGAFYHVITRGNHRQKIFKEEGDFTRYLEIISDYKRQYNYRLYSFVLMNNHVHLLIETRAIPLSKILQGINQRYTMYFNKKYKTVGHLFQGRYKVILCDRDKYLLTLVKYIHLNPVRARVVKRVHEYRWSSHNSYAGKSGDGIIDRDQVLRMFSEDKRTAMQLYKAYIEDGRTVDKLDIYGTIDQRILGDERFRDKVMEKAEIDLCEHRPAREYSLSAIASAIEEAYGIKLVEIRSKGKVRVISTGRKVFSQVARAYGYKEKDIATYTRKDPAIITRYLKDKTEHKIEAEKVIEIMKREPNVNRQA
jgi:REP element-mobilizing transposase RayT